MFVPIIMVFECNNASKYITLFENNGYYPYYNSRDTKDYQWFINNIKTPHRLYMTGKSDNCPVLYDFTVDDLEQQMFSSPEFAIVYGVMVDMNDLDWDAVYLYVRSLLFGLSGDELLVKRGASLMEKPVVEKHEMTKEGEVVDMFGLKGVITRLSPEYPKIDGHYNFRQHFLEERDTMLYEITRPNTLLPFTVLVEKFSVFGKRRLFSDIYGSSEWDMNRRECRYDYLFLQNLWKWMDLEGEFTMNVVKDRVEGCYPGKLNEGICPDPEPIVYRRSIEFVINSLCKKDNGLICEEVPQHIKRKRVRIE